MFPIRIKACSESDLRMLGNLARNIQRVLPVTQADIDAAAALGKGWVVWKVIEVNDPIDNLRGGTQLVIKQNSITPGQNVRRVLIVSGPGGETVVIGPGPSPLLLPDAIANSLSYVKAFGGTEQRNIPVEYTQVNYVTNTTATAVSTGVMLDITKKYELEVRCRAVTGSWYILQSRASGGSITGISGSSTGNTIIAQWAGVGVSSSISRTLGNTLYVKATFDNGNITLYVKDETAGTEDTATGTYSTSAANPSTPVYLWGNAKGDRVDINSDVYMVRIKENGVTLVDWIPCRQSTTAGFYDTITDAFITATTPSDVTADGDAVPSPDAPMDIVCNNGVLKLSPNLVEFNETRIDSTTWAAAGKTKGFEVCADVYNKSVGSQLFTNQNCFGVFVPAKINESVSLNFFDYSPFYSRCYYCEVTADGKCNTAPVSFASGSAISQQTFTLTQADSIGFVFEWYLSSQQTRNYTKENYMIVRGTTPPTKYIPYGKIYADGTVETINVHGKNLNGGGALDNKGYSSTGGTSTSTNFCGTMWKIKCKEGEKYTVSFGNFPDGISGVFINTWKTDGTWNTRQAIAISGAYTYTIPVGIGEVNFTLYKTGGITIASNSWLQVEKGETATAYEPYYDGGTATAEMLLKVGDYQDEQEILSGAVTRKVGVLVLDGTEAWSATGDTYGVALKQVDYGYVDKVPVICSHFAYSSNSSTTQTDVICNRSGNFGLRILANSTIMPNASTPANRITDFRTWLADQYAAGTPVTVYYPLETPTTESVAGQTLQVQDGDNIVEITQASIDGLELEVTYEKEAE